ncbi:inositol-3-phosphate synthase [Actinoallomurus iriomotensis]|uniref:Myo-inositol-1-phosphate synthase n=1 Tax=Actinoallomurus iriomotensis TaxID=478107 RepID=A0A9W6S0Z4_9ACTN|nr:inositol-3-phosphate synthase [Actinoallomurus iriomotensis]GLY85291.1 myo-inositol-1-phosphate synthase [Actinoallomurus iriomotensis]
MTTGVWLVGARGSVATTAVVGAAAVAAGLTPPTGCVTESPDFAGTRLPDLGDLVFGGHDVAGADLAKRAEQLVRSGVVPAGLPELVTDDLAAADAEIRPGVRVPVDARDQATAAAALASDIAAFRERRGLDRVVVINVASTEPPAGEHPAHGSLDALSAALASGNDVLPASSLYAYAALTAGCPYVDFTPSTGARLPALDELARRRGVPYAGRDGKTGETLLKSVLAPMFAQRALRVRAWSGTNLLGGGDGATLADPAAAAAKNASKSLVVGETLGYPVDGQVHIDYVADLGDWKTAWDHVVFDGFLGARMSLQFTWQGCDSALAAPLILDLARLMDLAHASGRAGPVNELAFFFKDPVGADGTTGGPGVDHALATQYATLRSWAASR